MEDSHRLLQEQTGKTENLGYASNRDNIICWKFYQTVEPKKKYPYRSKRTPVVINWEAFSMSVLYNCTVGSWQLYRHTATAVNNRQSSWTYREKASQFMSTEGGGGCLLLLQGYTCIFFVWNWSNDLTSLRTFLISRTLLSLYLLYSSSVNSDWSSSHGKNMIDLNQCGGSAYLCWPDPDPSPKNV